MGTFMDDLISRRTALDLLAVVEKEIGLDEKEVLLGLVRAAAEILTCPAEPIEHVDITADRLRELAQADKEGRVVVLQSGDSLWGIPCDPV